MTNPEIIKVKTKEEVYATLADEMATCWWMFGEGKFDYVGKNFWKKENYCSICDQISFDNSLKKISEFKEGRIDKDDVYDYLAKTQYSEKQTYSDYLFGTNDLNALKTALSKNQNAEVNFGTIDFEKQYYVMMGITSEVSGRVWKLATAGVVTVAGIFIPGVGWTWAGAIVGAAIIGGGEYGALQGPEILSIAVEGDGVPNTFMAPTIVEVNSEELKALNCDSITTLS